MTRVFSPFNYTTNKLSEFDFMIAISGKTIIEKSQLDNIKSSITSEFSEFLSITTLGSLGFILFVTLLLFLYAWCFISKKINHLTDFVNNP